MAILEGITREMLYLASKNSDAEAVRAKYRELAENGTIEWCSCGRNHGVIRNVSQDEVNLVEAFITWFFGSRSCFFAKGDIKSTYNMEFVPTTKTSPAPKRPWEWCGKTMLFPNWQQDETENAAAAANFVLGESVWFIYKKCRIDGIVGNIGKRITVIVRGGKYYVPPKDLFKK